MILQLIMIVLFIIYLFNSNRANKSKTIVIDKENKREYGGRKQLYAAKKAGVLAEYCKFTKVSKMGGKHKSTAECKLVTKIKRNTNSRRPRKDGRTTKTAKRAYNSF